MHWSVHSRLDFLIVFFSSRTMLLVEASCCGCMTRIYCLQVTNAGLKLTQSKSPSCCSGSVSSISADARCQLIVGPGPGNVGSQAALTASAAMPFLLRYHSSAIVRSSCNLLLLSSVQTGVQSNGWDCAYPSGLHGTHVAGAFGAAAAGDGGTAPGVPAIGVHPNTSEPTVSL